MSTSDSFVQTNPPSPSREVREVDGFRAAFYPGFARKITVRSATAETLLYEQNTPFVLPAGETRPWPSSLLEFSGGPAARDIRFQLEDPRQQVARIEIVFKAQDGAENAKGETLVVDDTPTLCPPTCPG